MSWIRIAPVTAEAIVVCVVIFASCTFEAMATGQRFGDVQREWGAIHSLHQFVDQDGVHRIKEPELRGPFDIWNGELWRIPVTAFHHADFFHLFLNISLAWYLGSRLEKRWGSFATLLFLVPAVCIPVMAELCCGNAVVGFSGVICAMLGAIAVQRQFDERLAKTVPVGVVWCGMAAIALCWLATLTDIVAVANIAHITGFLYGGIIAFVFSGPLGHVTLLRISLVLVHGWLIPGLIPVMHPNWIGRYHWYRAATIRNPQQAEKSLERATGCDPALAGAWVRWSECAERRGDLPEAWERLIRGIGVNPSNPVLIESSRRLWRHLGISQRRDAEKTLNRVFGKRATHWLSRIRNVGLQSESAPIEYSIDPDPNVDISEFALDRKIQLPIFETRPDRLERQTPIVPKDGNDAMEGESL